MASSFCASARIACADRRIVRRHARLEAMEHAAQLRQLPVHAHRLQPHAADARAVVGRRVAHDRCLRCRRARCRAARPCGRRRRRTGRSTASSSDTALGKRLPASMARRLISTECTGVRRTLISSRSVITKRRRTMASVGLRDFLLQVGHHADDFVAEHVEAQVLVRTEQRLARELGQRRVLREPGAAARVGERQMHPGPADVDRRARGRPRRRQPARRCRRARNDRPRRCRIQAWRRRCRRGSRSWRKSSLASGRACEWVRHI